MGSRPLVALAHDILIVLTVLLIFDRELDVSVIVALLTIIGYSLNDTIVIFDRIRENMQMLPEQSYADLINKSIQQSLVRTLITSLTTLFVIFCLWTWGGQSLENLSFTLMVGVFFGTYSSIFIASPILLQWHSWKIKKELQQNKHSY